MHSKKRGKPLQNIISGRKLCETTLGIDLMLIRNSSNAVLETLVLISRYNDGRLTQFLKGRIFENMKSNVPTCLNDYEYDAMCGFHIQYKISKSRCKSRTSVQ